MAEVNHKPGHFGYPTVVPGTEYVACAVHASWAGHEGLPPHSWIYTDIVHIGDDPLHEFLQETGEDGADNKAINALHRADFRRMAATTRTFGKHILEPMDNAEDAECRKYLRSAAKAFPNAKVISTRSKRMGIVRESGSYNIRLKAW